MCNVYDITHKQGLPGDKRDRTGARKCPQNDPWGVVNSARKKRNFFF
jgi:hypothetical protein